MPEKQKKPLIQRILDRYPVVGETVGEVVSPVLDPIFNYIQTDEEFLKEETSDRLDNLDMFLREGSFPTAGSGYYNWFIETLVNARRFFPKRN